MSKKVSKTGNIITLGVITGTAVTVGGFAAYHFLINKDKNKKYAPFKYKIKTLQVFGDLHISEANINPGENSLSPNPKYWLGEQGLIKLKNKIKNELGYGPEIMKLRDIVIGDKNNIGPKSNGIYYPGLDRLYINVDNYADKIDNFNYGGDENKLLELKVKLVFETIFHEFGHHIAATYLDNEWKQVERDQTIYSNGKLMYWNSYFTDKFETYLNYKNWEGIKFTDEIQKVNNGKFLYKSIGSVYSQQDLFKYSNQKEKYDWHEIRDGWKDGAETGTYELAGLENNTKMFPYSEKGKMGEKLSYMYSMDELYTRKYQQLNQVYDPIRKGDPLEVSGIIAWGSPTDSKREMVISSDLYSNAIYYQNGIGTPYHATGNNGPFVLKTHANNRFWNTWKNNPSTSNRYLYDAPFNNHLYHFKRSDGTTFQTKDHHEDLFNLMDGFIGHSTTDASSKGADISLVWQKNSLETNSALYDGVYVRQIDVKNAKNLFKFGGFVNSKDYASVGYMDANNHYQKLSEITCIDYKYTHKASLVETSVIPVDSNKENIFYTTNEFINKSELLGKTLWFRKNDGTTEKINSVRDGRTTGSVTTYQPHLYDIIGLKDIYGFTKDTTGNVSFNKVGNINE